MLLRPQKIQWIFPVIGENWIDSIPSKSTRKLVRHFSEVITENNLRFTWKQPSEAEYLEWLAFYEEKSREQNHDILAFPEWYQQKLQENKEVWYLVCEKEETGQFLGGLMVVKTPDNTWTSAYKVSERIDVGNEHNASLGILLDIEYMRNVQRLSPRKITAGTSRNAFGHTNTIGYLLSKLRKGYLPFIYQDNLVTDFPEKEDTPTIWFTRDAQTNEDFFLLSHEREKYNSEFFHFCEVQNLKYRFRDAIND
jgi:hypothetical protein